MKYLWSNLLRLLDIWNVWRQIFLFLFFFSLFQVISATQPDVVMVELCNSRVNILQLDEETLLEEARNINMDKIKTAIKQVKLWLKN